MVWTVSFCGGQSKSSMIEGVNWNGEGDKSTEDGHK